MNEANEIALLIVSVLGGITSLIGAIVSMRATNRKIAIEEKEFVEGSDDRKRELLDQVNNDTVGLYKQLQEQYTVITEKDRKLLRTVTRVIRLLIVLQKIVTDLTTELEVRIDSHKGEAEDISCPFYDRMAEYTLSRIKALSVVVSDTMLEVDTILLNGNGLKKENDDASSK